MRNKRKKLVGIRSCSTECVTDLDKQSKMIIFGSTLTTFESSSIFGGSWGSIENEFEPKNQTTVRKFSVPKSVKCSVLTKSGRHA